METPSQFFQSLTSLKLNHAWRGSGSCVVFEFGDLREGVRSTGESFKTGQASLMIEWSWRIEKPKSILGGSWSSETSYDSLIKSLIGQDIQKIETIGALHEIQLSLTSRMRIVSFMTERGQPAWSLFRRFKQPLVLFSERGRLKFNPIAA